MFGAKPTGVAVGFGSMATINTDDAEGTEHQPATDPSEVKQDGIEDGVSQTQSCGNNDDNDDVSPKPSRDKGDFGEAGRFDDEVALRFDDGDEMHVSTGFLKMASPVFTRMLEADFKEKATRVVELEGKDPDDFLELLWFLHPAVQKRITESTVFRILPLAEEYEVKSAISDCKVMMKKLLDNAVLPEKAPLCDNIPGVEEASRGRGKQKQQGGSGLFGAQTAVYPSFGASSPALFQTAPNINQPFGVLLKPTQELRDMNRTVITTDRRHVKSLHDCLKVFEAAAQFLYGEIEDGALKLISKYPAKLYTEMSAPKEHANIDCFKQYSRLDDREKIKVLNGRLEVRDDVCNINYRQWLPPGTYLLAES